MLTVKRAIADAMREATIAEVTIIEGQHIHYSGPYDKLTANCDPSMIVYRNALLKREIAGKSLFNHRKLFIFIKEE